MKVLFPNSAWVDARERLILAQGRLTKRRLKVRYGVIIHPDHGVILIDTGYTAEAVKNENRSAILRLYSKALGPVLNLGGQPDEVLSRLGYDTRDVRMVIVTHFHADHVSGLRQFPNARFVVDGAAWDQVATNSAFANLRHGVFTELLPDDFADRILDLSTCRDTPLGRDILGDGSLIAVPLPGHAAGHFGVIIQTDPTPIFYAVDAQWLRAAATQGRAVGYPARFIMDDYGGYLRSSAHVARMIAQGQNVVFCHDPEDGTFDDKDAL